MGILSWIVFAPITEIVAKLLTPGRDPGGYIITMLLGVAGAFGRGFLYRLPTDRPQLFQFDLGSIVIAAIGAIILLLLYRLLTVRRARQTQTPRQRPRKPFPIPARFSSYYPPYTPPIANDSH